MQKEKQKISLNRTAVITNNMNQLNVVLPESNHQKSILMQMDNG